MLNKKNSGLVMGFSPRRRKRGGRQGKGRVVPGFPQPSPGAWDQRERLWPFSAAFGSEPVGEYGVVRTNLASSTRGTPTPAPARKQRRPLYRTTPKKNKKPTPKTLQNPNCSKIRVIFQGILQLV